MKNVRVPVMVKPRRMLLKKNKRDSSIKERMTKVSVVENLSTMASERYSALSQPNLIKTFSAPNLKTMEYKNRMYPTVHDHPLYEDMNEHQITRFEDFKIWAYDAFIDFNWSEFEVQKTCLGQITMLRFCYARNFQLKAVKKMWLKWVNWFIDYRPDLITTEDVKDIPLYKYFKIHKTDLEGRPIIVMAPQKVDIDIDVDECMKVWLYLIDKSTRRSDRVSDGKITVIFDREFMTQAKDRKWFPFYKTMGQHLQDYFPERLNVAVIVNANWFVKVIVSMWKVFLAKSTKDKIGIVKNNASLLKYIPEENIPEKYQTNPFFQL
jgi:hypothetical protein